MLEWYSRVDSVDPITVGGSTASTRVIWAGRQRRPDHGRWVDSVGRSHVGVVDSVYRQVRRVLQGIMCPLLALRLFRDEIDGPTMIMMMMMMIVMMVMIAMMVMMR